MRKYLYGPAAAILLILSATSFAQDAAEINAPATQTQSIEIAPIIAKVKAAYGGKKLEDLKSIRIQTDRGLAWPGQGQTADFVEFVSDKSDVQIDLINRRASFERWVEQNGDIHIHRSVSAPDGGIATINYSTGTYEVNKDATYFRTYGVRITGSDTLIAHALVTDPHDIVFEDKVYYLGKWHDRITFKISPKGFPGTAFIEQDTGLITRFEVPVRETVWNAIFKDHQKSRGLTYARQRMDFRHDEMVQTDPNRRYSFNTVRWSKLGIEDYLSAPPQQTDMSEMTVDMVSATVAHVGQEDYSAFIDAGDYIIAANPYGGLKERLAAYRKETSSQKPLRYALITHHHSDHLSGVDEAIELGAKIVATPMTIKAIQAEDDHDATKLQTLKAQDTIGPVKIYTVPTNHAVEYAVIYVPSDKLVYQDDHYYPSVADGPSHVNQTGLVFKKRVDDLGLDVDILLSGHARKAEKWADFAAAAAKQTLGDKCPRNREICRD